MKASDLAQKYGDDSIRSLFSWVRYLTGLAAGSFTFTLAFREKFIVEDCWFQVGVCSLFLTIVFGASFLGREQAALGRLSNGLFGIVKENPPMVAVPELKWWEKSLLKFFYLTFLTAYGSLLYNMLTAIPK